MTPLRSLRRLGRDRRGVTAIEFAIVAPVMLLLICGTFEMGHIMYARSVLEGAIVEAARAASSTMETNEVDRTLIMRKSIEDSMAVFTRAKGKSITIETKVYRDFSTAYPETYTDTNGNGKYDFGEAYVDRNMNGKWDPAVQVAGTLGGPGDVVSYTAIFPKQILFNFIASDLGLRGAVNLSATTVMRNENMVRKTTL
jgi:Flp pilus assembly protein TadG